MIGYDDLKPELIVFELRYSDGYLYLDNCGKIIKEISENLRDAGSVNVSTKTATIEFIEKELLVAFSPHSINIKIVNSKNVKMLGECSDLIVHTVCRFLDINVFSRIGNRFQFIKPTDSPDDFSNIFKNKIINIPETVTNKLGNSAKHQAVKFTIDRDESFGYNFSFAYTKRDDSHLKSQGFDTSKITTEGIVFDIDIFTTKAVLLSTLKCSELIRKNIKDYEFLVNMFVD
ncbi:MAG: hypothetical protein HQL61_01225 [Magnetococcales bacterium]|nr:hypothetical protein [Nitrospirota bacterium]